MSVGGLPVRGNKNKYNFFKRTSSFQLFNDIFFPHFEFEGLAGLKCTLKVEQ